MFRLTRKTAVIVVAAMLAAGVAGYVAWAQIPGPDFTAAEQELEDLLTTVAGQVAEGDGLAFAELLGDPAVIIWCDWTTGESSSRLVGAVEREAIAGGDPGFIPPADRGLAIESVEVQMLGPAAAMATLTLKVPDVVEPIPGVGVLLSARHGEWKISAITIPR